MRRPAPLVSAGLALLVIPRAPGARRGARETRAGGHRLGQLVSGWRVRRQDNLVRRINALGWYTVVALLFGRTIHDIDCGFKLFRREVLNHIHVESNGAMIDTEMLAEMKARGYKLTDVPVTHLPRLAGSPTGANLKVILRAFRDLFKFRLRLWCELREEKRVARAKS